MVAMMFAEPALTAVHTTGMTEATPYSSSTTRTARLRSFRRVRRVAVAVAFARRQAKTG